MFYAQERFFKNLDYSTLSLAFESNLKLNCSAFFLSFYVIFILASTSNFDLLLRLVNGKKFFLEVEKKIL